MFEFTPGGPGTLRKGGSWRGIDFLLDPLFGIQQVGIWQGGDTYVHPTSV